MSNRIAFAFVFLAIGLHLLRNLSLTMYAAIYLFAMLIVVVGAVTNRRAGEARLFSIPITIWVVVAIYGSIVTLIFSGGVAAAFGLVRFLFAAPLLLALAYFTRTHSDLIRHLQVMAVFVAACAASIPLQIATGAVSWFAEDSVRGSFERYGSLAGSLTSFGIIVGCFIALTLSIRMRFDWLLVSVMLIGIMSSLSKAAIANAIIGLLVGTWINRRRLGRVALTLVPLVAVVALATTLAPSLYGRFQTVLMSFGVQQNPELRPNYDSSVSDSVIDRLTTLPLKNFEALNDLNSPLAYLSGGGFGMAATALVPRSASLAPMAHNQYAELMTVFGLVGGLLLILFMAYTGFNLVKRSEESPLAEATAWSYAIFLVNGLFANGTVYQPVSGAFFFLAIFVAFCDLKLLIPNARDESMAETLATKRRKYGRVTHL